ncbi:GGDEF domain-containing protein [Chitiniphilus shinanonensis]|uniref:GGDEF domain-containing protein n=1 Tax=Chitiniphilus shinanonensis TaxID=553088 RepID=UPI0012F850D5|nr:GGDEF domain-containing protein [Chitiniphilus shinanonensis]
MKKLTLDQKFHFGSLAIVLIAVALAGQLMYHSYQELQTNRRSLENLTLYHAVLNTANLLAAERGDTFRLLSDLRVHDYPQRRSLAEARQRSDAELERVSLLITRHHQDFIVAGRAVARLQRNLVQARAVADQLAAEPLATRDDAEIRHVIASMYRVAEDLRPAITETGVHASETDRRISDAVLMSQTMGNMREYAGRLAAQLMVPLIKHQAIDASRQQRINHLRDHLNELAGLLNRQVGNYWNMPGMQQARHSVAQRYFGDGYGLLDSVLRQGSSARLPSVMAFTDRYTQSMRSIEQLQTQIIHSATRQALRGSQRAKREAIAAMTLCCALIVALIILLHISRRRMLVPLLQARKAIIDLADGNLLAARPPRGGPEVEQLFDAIDVLRANQEKRLQTERRLAEMTQQLKHQAETDTLTGVHNRRALETIGEQLLNHAEFGGWRVGLVMFDIDHFKKVNDVHGHPIGDLVLKTVAQTVARACRNEDNIGRVGGEEFIVLVPLADARAVRAVAEKLRQRIENLRIALPSGGELRVTASFGIALSGPHADWDKLVTQADTALYEAKHSGRNRVAGLERTETMASPAI